MSGLVNICAFYYSKHYIYSNKSFYCVIGFDIIQDLSSINNDL
jgi:hypothetical protein